MFGSCCGGGWGLITVHLMTGLMVLLELATALPWIGRGVCSVTHFSLMAVVV
jgi:hypothetical protein